MKVKIVETLQDLQSIIPTMLQLRPQYTAQSLLQQIQLQQQQGYQLACVVEGEDVLCVAGFVLGNKLAWQKHIYVDDLVTSESKRSTGAGKCLIDWLKQYARDNGCQQLHLDSGVQRFGAHRFYLREGFDINSHHFAISNLNADQS